MNFNNGAYTFFAVAFLLIAASLNSYSQLNSGNITQFTENDGLPGAQVNKLLVDRFGYIWAGTINGLARYDGYEFKRFYPNPNDSASIHGLIVWSLFEDSKGHIWIGSNHSFLNVYDPVLKNFRQYDFEHLVPHAANIELLIGAMCEDNNGRIYFGVNTYLNEKISSALLYKDEKDDTIKRFDGPGSSAIQNIVSMAKDKSGNIWFLTTSALFKIDTATRITEIAVMKQAFNKEHEYPTDIKIDKAGHIWIITTASRLYDFNPAKGIYTAWLSDKLSPVKEINLVHRVIDLDSCDNIWLTANTGVQYFDRKTGKFSIFNSGAKKQLEHPFVNHLAVDSFGTLWIGTLNDGLLKYENKAQLRSYTYNKADKNSITAGWANFFYESSDGKIWIGTSGSATTAGINVLDTRTGLLTPIPFSRYTGQLDGVFSLWQKAPGELYVAGFKKLFALSEKTYQLTAASLAGAPDTITILYYLKDSRQNEWLCTLTGLYKKDKGSQVFKRVDLSTIKNSDASSNQITRAYESKKHGLWLTTDNGLFLYNYNNDKIERHGFDKTQGDIFVTQDINSFYEDPQGIAWVGTWQGGLSRYNVETKKIETYTRNNGLPSMSIQSIVGDEKNNALWLSTFEGLSRFDMQTHQFSNYSIADGIQGQLFADGAYIKTSKGLIAFGGSNGITIFNPDEIDKNSIPPKVFLTNFKIHNQPVIPGNKSVLKTPIYTTDQVTLPYYSNNISIEFTALHYSNPSKNMISYTLENYDNEWRNAGSQHEAVYQNLPPGEYIFHVKAANDKGVWNEEGAILKIIIKLPWWRTTPAYMLYVLLITSIVLLVNRYLRNRLLQQERERNRERELKQAKEIKKAYYELERSHEVLKSTQTQLIQSEKMASLGELTAGIAHEIQNPLNFVNNFSEVSNELVDEMKEELQNDNKDAAIAIADDLKQNLEKINYHGHRADSIVKGMLQHSRKNTGQKEPTDINKLADEFLRLAYHGLRSKNKVFNADIKTVFDENIGQINVIPQDIGRVLLNLFNNALYAVNERQKVEGEKYKPVISVQTKKLDGKIEIRVGDNGSGISSKILDKIFQPFFTTKPSGEGTGLGLSLSYDIIKAYGGEIKVETKEGEGSEFIIQLPAS